MDRIRTSVAYIAGVALRLLIAVSGKSAGGTWPGEIALRIDPLFVKRMAGDSPIILVCGTNGKTTTARMITTILRKAGRHVWTNASGANLMNGIASVFLRFPLRQGNGKRTFVFEVDEAALPRVMSGLPAPSVIVLLNLFRDQLDRYGEIDMVAARWRDALRTLPATTVCAANADDPGICALTENLACRMVYFGIEDTSLYENIPRHTADSIFCPKCGNRLTYGGVYFSHMGKWACGRCRFSHPDVTVDSVSWNPPIPGIYNIHNTLAAVAACMAMGVDEEDMRNGLSLFTPAFGRQEQFAVGGKQVKLLLSKNPTGFDVAVRTAMGMEDAGPLMLALNDNVADGRDVSWIWDTDMEILKGYPYPVYATGTRCRDLAVRLKYALDRTGTVRVLETFEAAIKEALRDTPEGKTLMVLPTYTAMLGIRRILAGKAVGE